MDNAISLLNQQLTKSAEDNQYVTFSIDEDEFGIKITKVQEIIGYTKLTHVPNMPSFVKGVINLRGTIIPIIDLREKFNLREKEYDKYTVIVIVEISKKILGLIVDVVSDVISLTNEDIQELTDFEKIDEEYIKGMGKVDGKLIIILDIDKILTYNQYKQIDDVEHQ